MEFDRKMGKISYVMLNDPGEGVLSKLMQL